MGLYLYWPLAISSTWLKEVFCSHPRLHLHSWTQLLMCFNCFFSFFFKKKSFKTLPPPSVFLSKWHWRSLWVVVCLVLFNKDFDDFSRNILQFIFGGWVFHKQWDWVLGLDDAVEKEIGIMRARWAERFQKKPSSSSRKGIDKLIQC